MEVSKGQFIFLWLIIIAERQRDRNRWTLYLACSHWPFMYLYCSPILQILSTGSFSSLDMNLGACFKDDILEINMNECDH